MHSIPPNSRLCPTRQGISGNGICLEVGGGVATYKLVVVVVVVHSTYHPT